MFVVLFIIKIISQVKSRLQIYKQNVKSIVSTYSGVMNKVPANLDNWLFLVWTPELIFISSNLLLLLQIDGNRPKDVVFKEIDFLLSKLQEDKEDESISGSVSHISDGFFYRI